MKSRSATYVSAPFVSDFRGALVTVVVIAAPILGTGLFGTLVAVTRSKSGLCLMGITGPILVIGGVISGSL